MLSAPLAEKKFMFRLLMTLMSKAVRMLIKRQEKQSLRHIKVAAATILYLSLKQIYVIQAIQMNGQRAIPKIWRHDSIKIHLSCSGIDQ